MVIILLANKFFFEERKNHTDEGSMAVWQKEIRLSD